MDGSIEEALAAIATMFPAPVQNGFVERFAPKFHNAFIFKLSQLKHTSAETWGEIGVPGGVRDSLIRHIKLADAVVVHSDDEDEQDSHQGHHVKEERVKKEILEAETEAKGQGEGGADDEALQKEDDGGGGKDPPTNSTNKRKAGKRSETGQANQKVQKTHTQDATPTTSAQAIKPLPTAKHTTAQTTNMPTAAFLPAAQITSKQAAAKNSNLAATTTDISKSIGHQSGHPYVRSILPKPGEDFVVVKHTIRRDVNSNTLPLKIALRATFASLRESLASIEGATGVHIYDGETALCIGKQSGSTKLADIFAPNSTIWFLGCSKEECSNASDGTRATSSASLANQDFSRRSLFVDKAAWQPTGGVKADGSQTDTGMACFMSTMYVIADYVYREREDIAFQNQFVAFMSLYLSRISVLALTYLLTMRKLPQPMRCGLSAELYAIFRVLVPVICCQDVQVFEYARHCWAVLLSRFKFDETHLQVEDECEDGCDICFARRPVMRNECHCGRISTCQQCSMGLKICTKCAKPITQRRICDAESLWHEVECGSKPRYAVLFGNLGLHDEAFLLVKPELFGALAQKMTDTTEKEPLTSSWPGVDKLLLCADSAKRTDPLFSIASVSLSNLAEDIVIPCMTPAGPGQTWDVVVDSSVQQHEYTRRVRRHAPRSGGPALNLMNEKVSKNMVTCILLNPLGSDEQHKQLSHLKRGKSGAPDKTAAGPAGGMLSWEDENTDGTNPDIEEATVVLMDTSVSMTESYILGDPTSLDRLMVAKHLFIRFAEKSLICNFPHKLGLILFNSNVTTACSFQDSAKVFHDHILSAEASGRTALYDALTRGLDLIRPFRIKQPKCLFRLFVLSDGHDTRSSTKFETVFKRMVQENVVVDAVLIGDEPCQELKELCAATKGLCFRPTHVRRAMEIFESESIVRLSVRKQSAGEEEEKSSKVAQFTSVNEEPQLPAIAQPEILTKPVRSAAEVARANPIGLVNSGSTKQVLRELRRCSIDPDLTEKMGIKIFACEADVTCWQFIMPGPPSTPYENGRFLLYATFPPLFPQVCPEIRFSNRIYHCNVDTSGRICHAIFGRGWTSNTKMTDVIKNIYQLLVAPEPDHPLDAIVAEEYYVNYEKYEATARDWSTMYKYQGLLCQDGNGPEVLWLGPRDL